MCGYDWQYGSRRRGENTLCSPHPLQSIPHFILSPATSTTSRRRGVTIAGLTFCRTFGSGDREDEAGERIGKNGGEEENRFSDSGVFRGRDWNESKKREKNVSPCPSLLRRRRRPRDPCSPVLLLLCSLCVSASTRSRSAIISTRRRGGGGDQ